ncbi:MTH865 family protein [Natrononativus amylolyticus]|uniref:MTH865 family protein n=1 Tax=Natrononativus amylolyticus TaxID=2963434 RepID=UPI0020CDDC46|nr:MTH865 family protein [Natrononativus amylolyticus]
MADEAELREQMTEAFEGADYPISSPMDLVPALPNGPGTKFESEEFSMTAMELNTKLDGGDFPYENVDAFVDDVIEQLKEQDYL